MNKRNILEYLEETSRRYPDKIAVRGGGEKITFKELEERAKALGSALIKKGICREPIAILMDKHPDTVCAFLGTLYAGCFYICIDPDTPDSRIRTVAEKTHARAVIFNENSRERAHVLYGRARLLALEELCLCDTDEHSLNAIRKASLDTDPALVSFTSGSSGEPKGICTSHRSLIDYCDALLSTLPIDSQTVFGNQAPLYYDACLKELLPMLAVGATVIFIPSELFSFPVRLCEFILEEGINTLCHVSSVLSLVSALGALDKVDMSALRLVCFGGEVMPTRQLNRWRNACPHTAFYNLYGPSEATGMSSYYRVERELSDNEPIPIGKPFPNTEIMLLDADGKKCAAGQEGEIYIRGTCVALGYFGERELSGGFVQDPMHRDYPETVFRTGDMAVMNEYGELIYLGRRDRQIKIMGRRIEPREIEACALECDGVYLCELVFDPESMKMTLFYVGHAEPGVPARHLEEHLPRFMLPHRCVSIEEMPRMSNGKVDISRMRRGIYAEVD